MTEAADKTTSLWNDRYLAYIPLLGAAVAVTFDVGYFFALNWSFFTLFSLSEHILFAIQAFPIALGIILFSFNSSGHFFKSTFPLANPTSSTAIKTASRSVTDRSRGLSDALSGGANVFADLSGLFHSDNDAFNDRTIHGSRRVGFH